MADGCPNRCPRSPKSTLRLTRLRPSVHGADVWDNPHPLLGQQRELYDWLMAHGDNVLTDDLFFHLAAFGESLPGLNLCGAGRVVCLIDLIDLIADVYACPFAIRDNFLAGSLLTDGGFPAVPADLRVLPGTALPANPWRLLVVPVLRLLSRWLHGRRSSSPASHSTVPIPGASRGTASTHWPPNEPSPRPARTTPSRPPPATSP